MTLRWPGHVEKVIPLMRDNRLVEVFGANASSRPPDDLVAMEVRMTWDDVERKWTLIDRYDPKLQMTAMARTTALTTARGASRRRTRTRLAGGEAARTGRGRRQGRRLHSRGARRARDSGAGAGRNEGVAVLLALSASSQ